MNLDEHDLDPRFRDPARFPCAVTDCPERAAGWVLPLHLPSDLQVRTDMERVYLCDTHLREALPGWTPSL